VFCRPVIVCLLACITSTIQATEGRMLVNSVSVLIHAEVKGKAVPLQALSGPEGSRKLRFTDYMTTAQVGGKVVSPTHRPTLPPGNAPGTHFC